MQRQRGLCGRAQVFAPLARLLGLYSLKEELEALAFRYADPGAHAEVQRRLDVLAAQQGAVVLQAQRALQAKLADDAYLRSRAAHVTVEAHQKAVYSVYRRAARPRRRPCAASAGLALCAPARLAAGVLLYQGRARQVTAQPATSQR